MTWWALTPSRIERIFAFAVILLASGAVLSFSGRGVEAALHPDAGSPLSQRLWILVYFGLFLIAVARPQLIAPSGWLCVVLWAAVGFACLSAVWSTAPSVTLRHGLALAGTTALGTWLGRRFSLREALNLLSGVLGLIAVGSVVAAVFFPRYGLDPVRHDAWSGLFGTKNELGRLMAFSTVIWSLKALGARRRRFSVAMVGLSLLLVILSQSRTGLIVVLIFAIFVTPALRLLRSDRIAAVPGFALLVIGAGALSIFALDHIGRFVGSFGADPTLTGRTRLWAVVLQMIHRRLWFGYGYGGFWRGVDGPSIQVWNALNNTPPHSHNGLLDALLDVGAVGTAILCVALFGALVATARVARKQGSVTSVLPLVVLVFIILSNITESSFFVQNSMEWLLFTTLVVQAEVAGRAAVVAAGELHLRPSAIDLPAFAPGRS